MNYIYQYDIHGQTFNSSFQDRNSDVVQRLQTQIADWTSEELSKQNLISYISDRAQIRKILDVSKHYDNHPTIRLHISINLYKNFIPTIRHIFESICERLQKENSSISREKISEQIWLSFPEEK